MAEGRKKKEQKSYVSFKSLSTTKNNKQSKIPFRVSHSEIKEEDSSDSDSSSTHLINEDKSECLIARKEVNISILKKYIYFCPKSTVPRPVFIIPCNNRFNEIDISNFFRTTSTRKLYQTDISEVDVKLLIATKLGKMRAVRKAIRNGADVNIEFDGQTPLLIAAENGNIRLVSYLLKLPEINVNYQDGLGRTPLMLALGNQNEAIMKLLLKYRADVNLADNMGKTPLHWAIYNQHESMVKLLLAFGADCEKHDCFGGKPVYTASVEKPNLGLLKVLLKYGANPDDQKISGISLLSRSVLNGTNFKIIEELVRYGASVNSQDNTSKKTPLHFAALMDDIKVAELLVNVGADISLKTTYNFTALDEANFQRSYNVIDFLTTVPNFKSSQ